MFKSLEPSSGGIGMRLNMPIPRLMEWKIRIKSSVLLTKESKKLDSNVTSRSKATVSKYINNEKNAQTKLIAGPANAVMAKSRLGFLKFLALIGTGLAQPK